MDVKVSRQDNEVTNLELECQSDSYTDTSDSVLNFVVRKITHTFNTTKHSGQHRKGIQCTLNNTSSLEAVRFPYRTTRNNNSITHIVEMRPTNEGIEAKPPDKIHKHKDKITSRTKSTYNEINMVTRMIELSTNIDTLARLIKYREDLMDQYINKMDITFDAKHVELAQQQAIINDNRDVARTVSDISSIATTTSTPDSVHRYAQSIGTVTSSSDEEIRSITNTLAARRRNHVSKLTRAKRTMTGTGLNELIDDGQSLDKYLCQVSRKSSNHYKKVTLKTKNIQPGLTIRKHTKTGIDGTNFNFSSLEQLRNYTLNNAGTIIFNEYKDYHRNIYLTLAATHEVIINTTNYEYSKSSLNDPALITIEEAKQFINLRPTSHNVCEHQWSRTTDRNDIKRCLKCNKAW